MTNKLVIKDMSLILNFRMFFRQMSVFVVVSGIGWLIDLSVFFLLTNQFALNVFYSNILSSIPGFTFVFVVSTNKIF